MGNDLLSPRGTPNVAVVDGTISTRPWAGGGITIFLDADDGPTYVYMHLLQIVGAVPRRVVQGDVIGLVGQHRAPSATTPTSRSTPAVATR